MSVDFDEKLQIETTRKFNLPGVEVKEMKVTHTVRAQEIFRKRIAVAPSSPDQCKMVESTTRFEDDLPFLDTRDIEFMIIKLSKNNGSKGPVFVNNEGFTPATVDPYCKLEGDGSIAFWKDDDRFKPAQNGNLFVFNPSNSDAILEIFFGLMAKSKDCKNPNDPMGKGAKASPMKQCPPKEAC